MQGETLKEDMNYQYIDLNNQNDLIDGVILRKLTIHKDHSGTLVETLRSDWPDVAGDNFAMQYMSITPPSVARDEDKWHLHKNQKDRFICVAGRIVTAIFDARDSPTRGRLNLFVMGPDKVEDMYMVVIPEETYHGFMAISKIPAYLLNFPTQLYNQDDEGRVPQKELSWQKVREDFNLQ